MIKEATIDATVLAMQEEGFEDLFVTESNEYWQYLNSKGFEGMGKKEHELMFFLNSVIFNASKSVGQAIEFDIEEFQDKEEQNWASREEAKDWVSAKDSYFDGYEEEDLLAFVEDIIVSEESEELTELGKEVLFITCKSYIDLLIAES